MVPIKNVIGVATGGLLLSASVLHAGNGRIQRAEVDEQGFRIRIVENTVALPDESNPVASPRTGTLFLYHHDASVAASVSLGALDTSWAGQELNVERLQTFQTFGDGDPAWEHSYDDTDSSYVGVAAAEQFDLALSIIDNAGIVEVRGFGSKSNSPLWTYDFEPPFISAGHLSAAVSRDGSTAVALATDYVGTQSRLAILNKNNGQEITHYDNAYIATAVFLSTNGARAIVTSGSRARIIDTATGVEIFSANTSGTGGTHRMSANGKVFGVGGFNLKIYREIDGLFQQVYFEQESTQWYGNAVAFSADGHYAVAASFNYVDYTNLTYRIIDVFNASELARTYTTGTSDLQDTLSGAAVNDAGTVFATASWGLLNNDHPEVMLFNRAAEVIGAIDPPGSVFSLDLSADGRVALSGSKANHANLQGMGGDVNAYEVFDPPACEGDVNLSGIVDPLDSGYTLSRFGCPVATGNADCDAADANADGIVDPLDVGFILSRFGPCE